MGSSLAEFSPTSTSSRVALVDAGTVSGPCSSVAFSAVRFVCSGLLVRRGFLLVGVFASGLKRVCRRGLPCGLSFRGRGHDFMVGRDSIPCDLVKEKTDG